MSNFNPLEAVGRGSETQLQVGGDLNCLILRFKDQNNIIILSKINRIF